MNRPRDIFSRHWKDLLNIVERDGMTILSSRRSRSCSFRYFMCIYNREMEGHKQGESIRIPVAVKFTAKRYV